MKGLQGHVTGFILRTMGAMKEKRNDQIYSRKIILVPVWMAQGSRPEMAVI